MRLLTLSLFLAIAALMTFADPGSAQSPTSYPWCSRGTRGSRAIATTQARSNVNGRFQETVSTASGTHGIGSHLQTAPGRAEDRAENLANVRSLA